MFHLTLIKVTHRNSSSSWPYLEEWRQLHLSSVDIWLQQCPSAYRIVKAFPDVLFNRMFGLRVWQLGNWRYQDEVCQCSYRHIPEPGHHSFTGQHRLRRKSVYIVPLPRVGMPTLYAHLLSLLPPNWSLFLKSIFFCLDIILLKCRFHFKCPLPKDIKICSSYIKFKILSQGFIYLF